MLFKPHHNHYSKSYSRHIKDKGEIKHTATQNYQLKRSTSREEKQKNGTAKHPENNRMTLVGSYLSIITLKVSVLHSPVKRHS